MRSKGISTNQVHGTRRAILLKREDAKSAKRRHKTLKKDTLHLCVFAFQSSSNVSRLPTTINLTQRGNLSAD